MAAPAVIIATTLRLVLAVLMLWAGGWKAWLAMQGVQGWEDETLINAVHEALKTSIFYRLHPAAFLVAVAVAEMGIGLALIFAEKRRPLVCIACALYIGLASVVAVLANPSLMGTLNCSCWGTKLLDFGALWQVLLRNALLIALCLWLARRHRARSVSFHGPE
ncbi:MAG: hypothetical protein L6Q71_07310 [Planctomycetes bacterium]|nr:hypothetical protein [Planctomycetota bacterium]NUQ35598.1 hypothetical protein [Planctomycetaceae bacterium]